MKGFDEEVQAHRHIWKKIYASDYLRSQLR